MERFNDFTYDKVNYEGLPEFVQEVHDLGMHYVQIFDPAVSGSEAPGTYPPYDDGKAMDIFVKNSTGQEFVGKVWNSKTSIFPDFTHPLAGRWWAKQMKRYIDEVPIDGAWIDMNEPANFFAGQIDRVTGKYSWATGCPWDNELEKLEYIPGDPYYPQRVTMCFSNQQYLGPHYNLHNMYAIYEAKATKE